MIYRITLLCLSFLLMASGTANAARGTCPVAEAQHAAQMAPMAQSGMHADCGTAMEDMDAPAPAGDMDHTGDTACCCPAIVAALPGPILQAGATVLYPPLYDTPLNASLVSLPSVPEPPPPRA